MAAPKKPKVNVFDDYAASRITLEEAYARSNSWYSKRIKDLSKITAVDLMRNTSMFTTKPRKGEIYVFAYDPKHKATLEYYDTFPLVLPLSGDKDSFLGLNFHYINPKYRMYLLQAIKKHGKGINRLNITWDIIAGWAGTKSAEHCLKRYLFSHMKTPMRRIKTQDIPTALLLSVEHFVKANKQQVWRDL